MVRVVGKRYSTAVCRNERSFVFPIIILAQLIIGPHTVAVFVSRAHSVTQHAASRIGDTHTTRQSKRNSGIPDLFGPVPGTEEVGVDEDLDGRSGIPDIDQLDDCWADVVISPKQTDGGEKNNGDESEEDESSATLWAGLFGHGEVQEQGESEGESGIGKAEGSGGELTAESPAPKHEALDAATLMQQRVPDDNDTDADSDTEGAEHSLENDWAAVSETMYPPAAGLEAVTIQSPLLQQPPPVCGKCGDEADCSKDVLSWKCRMSIGAGELFDRRIIQCVFEGRRGL